MIGVMVVEDDPGFLNRFCRIIASDAELEPFAAVPNAQAAFNALRIAAPDVLLVDLGLPDASGIEVIRATVQRYPDTDILVVTAFGDEEHALLSIEAGAAGERLRQEDLSEAGGTLAQQSRLSSR